MMSKTGKKNNQSGIIEKSDSAIQQVKGSTIRPVDFSTGTNIVIRVEDLWKEYRLGTINHGTLTKDLQSWWARMRGKEDPNLRIDQSVMVSAGSTDVEQDRFWALKDISFDVKQGEVLGIIGKNGAGKSTLLKILSQVTTPTRGQVKIKGRIASLLEVGTGFHPELTGRENIFLNGAILGMNKMEIRSKFDEIVAFAEIEKFIDTPVKRYSSGMYVRLAFAVAAHLEPEILIVDEVLAVGDVQFQKKCLGKIEEVGKEGRTVLFVSHNMSAIRKLCSRAILLNDGQIVAQGTPNDVINHYLHLSDFDNGLEVMNTPAMLKDLPGDSHIELTHFDFYQQGGQVGHWTVGRPLSVSVNFRIKKQTLNLRIFFDVLDEYENLLFRSFHDGDYDDQQIFEAGDYSSEAVIPADLLAPMRYTLRIGATIFGSHNCTGEHLRIPFTLYHGGRVNRAYSYEVYLGPIAPVIQWRTECCRYG